MTNVSVRKHQDDDKGLQTQRSSRDLGHWDPFSSELLGANPFSLLRRFHDEIDRSLGGLFSHGGTTSGSWHPAIEVAERDGKLHVRAELPGLKPEDVKVEVTDNALVLQGERKEEHEEKGKNLYRSERRYGRFYRQIPLPEGANTEQANAQFRDGILEVTMPVPEHKSNRRSIPISTER